MRSTSSTADGPGDGRALRAAARAGVGALALAALAAAAGWAEPQRLALALPDLCAFHRVTGHPCPGCGMGRSLAALAAGAPAASFAAHPFGPALALAAALAALLPARAWARLSGGTAARGAAAAVLAWWLLARVLPSA